METTDTQWEQFFPSCCHVELLWKEILLIHQKLDIVSNDSTELQMQLSSIISPGIVQVLLKFDQVEKFEQLFSKVIFVRLPK